MSPSIVQASVLALALASPAVAVYNLVDKFSGSTFFDNFNFITHNDDNGGFVNYVNRTYAEANSLIGYNSGKDRSFIGVDKINTLQVAQDPDHRGRSSVRLESIKQYTKGMFVLDLFHMPEPACGSWPAFWTVSHDNYPAWGEIDILENINQNTNSLHVLHTSPGCTIEGNADGVKRMNATVSSYNCDDKAQTGPNESFQYLNQGCAAVNTDPNTYGAALNANGGGTVVMEWTTHFIKMWIFQPNGVPANLKSGSPSTDTWGRPAFTTEGGSCTMDDHFKLHNIVININFCGTYAGQPELWALTTCSKTYPTCAAYVAANPKAFENVYWIINSLKVYKWTD